MVNYYSLRKIGFYHLKRTVLLVITLVVIANLVLGNFIFAKTITITDKDIEKIKAVLDWANTLKNIFVSENKLKTILNLTIKVGETSVDITYGIMVLTALSEMEFVDMVVSQRYKIMATEYFNQILDERLNLGKYYQGLGWDTLKVLSGRVPNPIAALTLNTFEITDKIFQIVLAIRNIALVKMYDGLWRYFNDRMNKLSHDEAWEWAKNQMGWMPDPIVIQAIKENTPSWARLLPGDVVRIDETINQLELQFAALWNNWGPYITPSGLSEEAKKQVKEELQNTLVIAFEQTKFVEEEKKSLPTEKIKLALGNLGEKIKDFGALLKKVGQTVQKTVQEELAPITSKIQELVQFGGAQISSRLKERPEVEVGQGAEQTVLEEKKGIKEETKPEVKIEEKPKPEEKLKPLTLEEIQEMIDDIAERIDVLNQKVAKLTGKEMKLVEAEEMPEEIEEPEIEEIEELEEIKEELAKEVGQAIVVLCQRLSGSYPARNKVIFNEIAWMGTANSATDEWIELKNISGQEIDLTGWQIINKDQKIKIIFSGGRVSANGFLLLERTDDESVPGIKADLIYTGALKNNDEALYLFDGNCQLQDEVLASPNWPAGENLTKRTMERKSDLGWQTSLNPGGTPKMENSPGYYVSVGGVSLPPLPPSPTYPKILISEIQIWDLTSNDHDFIELYNPNSNDVDISGWQLKKKNSAGNEDSVRVFPSGSVIRGQGYFLWANSKYASSIGLQADATSTQTLAQDNSIALLDPNKSIVDAVAWGSSTNPFVESSPFPQNPGKGWSLARKWSTTTKSYVDNDNNQNDFEIQNPTPKQRNNSLPTAFFTFSPQDPFVSDEITFDASSSTDRDGNITFYIWDFNDGNSTTTNQATTTYSFSTSGDFIITLRVVDDLGATSSPITTTITVSQLEEPTLTVVINEIAWMGTKTESNDEWIELYNNTDSPIDLTGWKIIKNGEDFITISTSTAATTTIQKFYLLERRHSKDKPDDTILDILADLIYTGALGNSGEKLELRDASGTLIDEVNCSQGWFAGVNKKENNEWIRISMERISATTTGATSTNWASNNLITRNGKDAAENKINGTPKAKNSVSTSPTTISSLPFDEFSEITLTYLGSPYIIQTNLTVPTVTSTLKIEPGVILKFGELGKMEVNGTLLATSSNEKIVFTSIFDPDYGGEGFRGDTSKFWSKIYFSPSSQNSKMENCLIRYGGNSIGQETTGIIWAAGSSVEIKNSIIEKFIVRGIRLTNSSGTIENSTIQDGFGDAITIWAGAPIIQNSIFKNTGGIYIGNGSQAQVINNNFENISNSQGVILVENSTPILQNNSGSQNPRNGIRLIGSINENWRLYFNNNFPYILYNSEIASSSILTIDPKVVIKFEKIEETDPRGKLMVRGKLIAEASTLSEEIVFTSITDDEYGGDTDATTSDPIYWNHIHFAPGSEGSLKNVRISYGGVTGDQTPCRGAIWIEKTIISFQDVCLKKNFGKDCIWKEDFFISILTTEADKEYYLPE